jgi:hypothetical protein
MLLDRSFLRFLPRFATLLSLYSSKHLLPSLSATMSTLQTASTAIFYEQHAKFKALYGLQMNWTLIRTEDEEELGSMQVAKRVTKKDWGMLKEVKVVESKKRHDHSFEDDMLSRSFMNQTIVSQKEVEGEPEEPSMVQEQVGAAEAEVKLEAKVLDAIVEEVKEEMENTQKVE